MTMIWRAGRLMVGAMFLACLLAVAAPGRAHEMAQADGPPISYPPGCCNRQDCRPLTPREVKFTPEGWKLVNGQVLDQMAGHPSPDNRFHACFYLAGPDIGKVRIVDGKECFYRPAGDF